MTNKLTVLTGTRSSELPKDEAEVSRRSFMKAMGASFAMVGAAGCVRKPTEFILPYSQRPEDLIPGNPRFFASCTWAGGQVLGILVESQEGRPTKIEGNPLHPTSGGSTNMHAQAVVLDLYDPDRAQGSKQGDKTLTKKDAGVALRALVQGNGSGLAVLVEPRPSPTFKRLLDELIAQYPGARVYVYDGARPVDGEAQIMNTLGAGGHRVLYNLDHAKVIAALDSDFLGLGDRSVALAKQFADGRRDVSTKKDMNRLYVVEPGDSVTGVMADNRLRLKAAQVGPFLEQVAKELASKSVSLPAELVGRLKGGDFGTWPAELAAELAAHKGASAVIVGERQPAQVHGLGLAINKALGNTANASVVADRARPTGGSINELVDALNSGSVTSMLVIGGNPVYDAPADLDFGAAASKATNFAYVGQLPNETATKATLNIASAHDLEAWGDLQGFHGPAAIRQPLIAPIFDESISAEYGVFSEIEVLSTLLGSAASDYEQVQATWRPTASNDFDKNWRRWVHDGYIKGSEGSTVLPPLNWAAAASSWQAYGDTSGIELNFFCDSKIYDGRYANNAWLQETPDPLTKLCWDNAALLSNKTAEAKGIRPGDLIKISVGGAELTAAALLSPVIADDVVSIALGYGHDAEGLSVAAGTGFNAGALRTTGAPFFVGGASISNTGDTYELASTQTWGHSDGVAGVDEVGFLEDWVSHRLTGRPHHREAELDHYKEQPDFAVADFEHMPESALVSLWQAPNTTTGQQWGLNIDLNLCNGCSTCITACTAENNVPTVGKESVLKGREMHWLRMDRYYWRDEIDEDGTLAPEEDSRAVMLPVACAQCEMAPCEQVCPVAATTHSPEGLNDIAYNRCIGTRYCANNCPTKVRRFNFFNFSKRNDDANPLISWQRNPDVTVRFRGVIEKCTYCVQRINGAKIEAKRNGKSAVEDGSITPACAQACPTQAIVFGDINQPQSMVSKARANERNYAVLAELNIAPRTTYLARVRNPNMKLISHKPFHGGHHGDASHADDAAGHGADDNSGNEH